ncbi:MULTISPECIES: cytochrome-ba3 oxidase subunit [Natrialba]|uniref:Cytochrome-ba3 oxidase subunit n=1 Tax=Natrialba swarupiae TaxID=2448032 RepID=A0A5D5ANF5_9EURY|nr:MULTISPECIES: cytochrome-ba3 oxidase subunit [Natrialba]MCW8173365.1 cytochrome-ba3 oxidase subunit [Natrialba swarupiae]MWV39040.1 cytochrome-ba3 oxidase subunit [Natrialba sp. INN-245]TYT61262.1 cytochrome-ba3 oxidase subunit [Natrialba swarupiae]
MLEDVSPRHAAAVGLLALFPTVVYGLGHPGLAGFVAAVNVVIIFGSLYIALSPIDEPNDIDDGAPS